MKPQFKKLFQIGIIVRDVDACVKHFEEDYGIGPWKIGVMSRQDPPFTDLLINGEPSDIVTKGAFLKAFGMEIELIEPLNDSAYKQWLDAHGPGVHHLAFATEDPMDKVIADHKKLTGKEPWIRGEAKGLGMDFAYLDLIEELGFMVECYAEDLSGKPGHDY